MVTEALAFTYNLYVFISLLINIMQAYLLNIYNLAVTFTLTPEFRNAEKQQVFQDKGDCLN